MSSTGRMRYDRKEEKEAFNEYIQKEIYELAIKSVCINNLEDKIYISMFEDYLGHPKDINDT